jgi:hypothetical protein
MKQLLKKGRQRNDFRLHSYCKVLQELALTLSQKDVSETSVSSVKYRMIKTKAIYDLIMTRIVAEDKKQVIHMPELGRKVEVAFSNSQLYIAVTFLHGQVWFPVQRDTLADSPLPPVPLQQTHVSKFSEKAFRLRTTPSTPPPPYKAHITWPPDMDAGIIENKENETSRASEKQGNIENNGRFHSEGRKANSSGKGLDKEDLQKSNDNSRARPRQQNRYHDPVSGTVHYEKKPGFISSSAYYSRRMVQVDVDSEGSKKEPGLVSRNTLRHRRLVDPKTGKKATASTVGPIPRHQYRNTRLVDPLTGKTATADTENPIPFSRFMRHGYRNRDTGERVKPGAPGAIPAAAYEKLLSERTN